MNLDTESETLKTLLETEIYLMLLYNLICESEDRVSGRSLIESERKEFSVSGDCQSDYSKIYRGH